MPCGSRRFGKDGRFTPSMTVALGAGFAAVRASLRRLVAAPARQPRAVGFARAKRLDIGAEGKAPGARLGAERGRS